MRFNPFMHGYKGRLMRVCLQETYLLQSLSRHKILAAHKIQVALLVLSAIPKIVACVELFFKLLCSLWPRV